MAPLLAAACSWLLYMCCPFKGKKKIANWGPYKHGPPNQTPVIGREKEKKERRRKKRREEERKKKKKFAANGFFG
ncbi:hypothetical protein E1A91_A07G226800v1 [Gossypium mustelinum]|uniref:Secreted protein n=1 Tax=Gossypium mustelinum TaxID=34275 RepID=A0A5D2YPU8_GOSMU|nr:hypothetical protein E1A91_A07G226800v1 [Gossypium mustelinum]